MSTLLINFPLVLVSSPVESFSLPKLRL